ncbi:hypothetical protein MD484_g6817, partial [Candolleomyces efflorescens]
MASSPSENMSFMPNATDVSIRDVTIYSIRGSQYVFPRDQATLIELLHPILDASHTRNRKTSPPDSECFSDTRVDVIRVIVAWADSMLLWNTHILWLHGFVGCGKSAIALAIALKFENRKRLVGSFFFFRNMGDRSNMARFAATLAFQLAREFPEARPFIEKAAVDGGLQQLNLVAQLRRLVYEPFKAAADQVGFLKTFLKPFLIVVDGLDECEDHQEVRAFIDDLLFFFKKNRFVPLRFLITSRIEQHIKGRLENRHVHLLDLVDRCSRNDIEVFMDKCFDEEKKRNGVIRAYIKDHGDWPTKEDKAALVDHIGGSFSFASTLIKYVIDPTDTSSTPMERLSHTLEMKLDLDLLYANTLSRSQDLPHFHEVISALALVFEPLPIVGIAELLGLKTFEVVRILINLHAIIHVPGTDDGLPVTICHTSLRDFLTESRSGRFFTSHYHLHLSYRCLMYRAQQRPDAAVARYSSVHCVEHFAKFISLPPETQALFTHRPQILDGIYTHILEKSENQPYFSEIIAVIALNPSLPSVSQMSELFRIDESKLLKLLANLQPIILLPQTTDTPITVRPLDVFQFLTEPSRSGRFFVSRSSYLKLSYYHFNLSLGHYLSHFPGVESKLQYGLSHSLWLSLGAISEPELKQLMLDLPTHTSLFSRHLFSFTRRFLRVFEDTGYDPVVTEEIPDMFVECLSSLALALDCDGIGDPSEWMFWWFHTIDGSKVKTAFETPLRIRQEQAVAMQSNIQRVDAAHITQSKPESQTLDRTSSGSASYRTRSSLRKMTIHEAYQVQPYDLPDATSPTANVFLS